MFHCVALVAQYGESVGPIMGNPLLQHRHTEKITKVNEGTFDSTFIYTSDTISLPIFDDFSSNKYQTYVEDFGAVGVTSDKVHRLEDESGVPYADGTVFTLQQTFRQTWVISTQTSIISNFDDSIVYVGDLASYPVTHIGTAVYPPYFIFDTVDFVSDTDLNSDTTWLSAESFQDSATQFFAPLSDPELYWLDHHTYHNYTFAHEPWSLGVATFDGTDQFGFPYDIGSTTTNFADYLTSKPIDLSGMDVSDSIYFSFIFQRQGFGDEPESTDSLRLEFYAHDLQQWRRVWSANGGPVGDFEVGHILVEDPDYFKKGFQFRFMNYGALSGALDHFHLDYVHLRSTLLGQADTLFKDFAVVYPLNTLLKDYTSVPWDHYQNNFTGKMSDAVEVVVRNNSNITENNQNGITEVFYSGGAEGNFTLIGQTLSGGLINYGPRTTYYSYHDFSTGYHYDETKTGISQVFDYRTTVTAPFTNFDGNDSTWSQQVFENYYAYDDGSAERAYGPMGNQARIAIRFNPYEADSLIGVQIHWVPSVNDVSNKLFLLKVWDDNNGVPGNQLYQDSSLFPRQPKYEFDRNLFTTYYFEDTMKVPVNGTFYIGWRQFDSDRLNVGLDMNNVNNANILFSLDGEGTWATSTYEGSVMIRPIFSTSMDSTLGLEQQKPVVSAPLSTTVYPNPTADMINVRTKSVEFDGMTLMDAQGRVLIQTENKQVDVSAYPAGMYFLMIHHSGETIKVIKR